MHCGSTSGQYSSTFAQVLAPYWNFEYTKVVTSGRWYGPRSCNWGSWTEVKSTSMQWLHLPYLCNFQPYSTLNHAMLVWCLLRSDFFCQQIVGSQMTEPLQCISISPHMKRCWKIETSMSNLLVLCALDLIRIHAYCTAAIPSAENVLLAWSQNDCWT